MLASVRIPGDTALYDVHVANGVVSRITPAVTSGVPGSQAVNLDGRFVVPGLWDEHVHMTQWALAANRIDLSGAASAREAADVVRSALSRPGLGGEGGSGLTMVGVGFRDAVWADVPSLELLDGGVPLRRAGGLLRAAARGAGL